MQAHQAPLIARFSQLIDETGCRHEADGQSFLAGRQPKADGNVGLARAAWPERDDVLAPDDELGTRQFEYEHLVEIRQSLEVEAVERLGCREPGRPHTPFNHLALPFDQFKLDKPQ